MLRNNTQRNIQNLYIWILPIVAFIKYVRWSWMFNQLIAMSIGWRMVYAMIDHTYEPFHASLLSEESNQSSVIVDNCEAFYQGLNIFGITTFEGWEVLLTIVFNIIILFMVTAWYKRNPYAGLKENAFIYMNIGLINLYCCNISKECFQILFYFLMVLAITKIKGYRRKTIGLSIVLFLTILYARKYYALVLMYFFILQFAVTHYFSNLDVSTNVGRKLMVYRLIALFAMFGVFHYIFLGYLEGENEDTYNEMVAANTRDSEIADSVITPIFTGNQVALALDYFIKIFRLSFPIELLMKFKLTYIPMFANQILLFYFVVRAFVRRNEMTLEEAEEYDPSIIDYDEDEDNESEGQSDENKSSIETSETEEESEEIEEEEDVDDTIILEPQDNKDTRMAALYLYLAFLLCSAAFEPDFGSWSRHLGCAFPFILWIL